MKKCPVCKKLYKPLLAEPDYNDPRPMQIIYPNAPAIYREQLISGICSEDCWTKLLGSEEEDLPYWDEDRWIEPNAGPNGEPNIYYGSQADDAREMYLMDGGIEGKPPTKPTK